MKNEEENSQKISRHSAKSSRSQYKFSLIHQFIMEFSKSLSLTQTTCALLLLVIESTFIFRTMEAAWDDQS